MSEFDENVKQSKEKAKEALSRVPEIQSLLDEAENKTGDARKALKDAESDANMASEIAKEAERIAGQASKVHTLSAAANIFSRIKLWSIERDSHKTAYLVSFILKGVSMKWCPPDFIEAAKHWHSYHV